MGRDSDETAIAKSRFHEVFVAPAMPKPTEVPNRKRKSRTTQGAIVSSGEYRKDLHGTINEREAKVAAKKAKSDGRTRKLSLKWAQLVEKAEDIRDRGDHRRSPARCSGARRASPSVAARLISRRPKSCMVS